jgi:hypothetical protein
MTKIYIVRGLGFGDDEGAFENLGAYTTMAKAEAQIESLIAENEEEGFEAEYDIEILDLE